jgi:hypothetical protein
MPSSVVSSMKYFPETAVLRVRFVSGLEYEYFKVPEKIYKEMRTSGSWGRYLNRYIKKQFAFKKID